MIKITKNWTIDLEALTLDEARGILMDAAIVKEFELRPNTLGFNRMHAFMEGICGYYMAHDRADVVSGMRTCMENLEIDAKDILRFDPLNPDQKEELDNYAERLEDYADGSNVMELEGEKK